MTLLLIPKTSSFLKRVPTGGNSSSPAGPGFPTLSTTLDYRNFNVLFASMGILADTEGMVEVTPGDKLVQWDSGFGLVMWSGIASSMRAKGTMIAYGRWWHHINPNYH